MILAEMRFRGTTWHHNPKEIKIESQKNISEEKLINGENILLENKPYCRVISGSGELFGEDCLQQYEVLNNLFLKDGSGLLSIPELKPVFCFFKELKMETMNKPDILRYSFKFIEDTKKPEETDMKPQVYVPKGDITLWDVSALYNIKIEKLVELNPQIKNPRDYLEVNEVRLK